MLLSISVLSDLVFQITDVDDKGAFLVYRSTRSGFSKYLMGKQTSRFL